MKEIKTPQEILNTKPVSPPYEGSYSSDVVLQVANEYHAQFNNEWVDVKERLPEKEGWYIVYGSYTADCPQKAREAIFHKRGKNYEFRSNDGIKTKNVTHWMPLPLSPLTK